MAPWDHGRQDSGSDAVLMNYLISLSVIKQSQLGVDSHVDATLWMTVWVHPEYKR